MCNRGVFFFHIHIDSSFSSIQISEAFEYGVLVMLYISYALEVGAFYNASSENIFLMHMEI